VLAWRLFVRTRASDARSPRWWAAALACAAVGSFAGGTYHGFGPALYPPRAAALWTFTTLAVGAASALLLVSAITASFTGRARRWWLVAVAAKFVLYSAWMLGHDAFVFVIADYGLTLVVVLALTVGGRLGGAGGWRSPLVGAVVVSALAAALQQSGVVLHRHFNHNDLQHVVQMVAMWLFYRGGARLEDAGVRTVEGGVHAG
jgi:hypothetical protein